MPIRMNYLRIGIIGACIVASSLNDPVGLEAKAIRLTDVSAMQRGVSPWSLAVDADLLMCEDALADCETGCESRIQAVNDYWRDKHDFAIEAIQRRDNEITRLNQRIKDLEGLANKVKAGKRK